MRAFMVGEDCDQRADSQRIVNDDGDMMLGGAGGQPQMTACLARGAITGSPRPQ